MTTRIITALLVVLLLFVPLSPSFGPALPVVDLETLFTAPFSVR